MMKALSVALTMAGMGSEGWGGGCRVGLGDSPITLAPCTLLEAEIQAWNGAQKDPAAMNALCPAGCGEWDFSSCSGQKAERHRNRRSFLGRGSQALRVALPALAAWASARISTSTFSSCYLETRSPQVV